MYSSLEYQELTVQQSASNFCLGGMHQNHFVQIDQQSQQLYYCITGHYDWNCNNLCFQCVSIFLDTDEVLTNPLTLCSPSGTSTDITPTTNTPMYVTEDIVNTACSTETTDTIEACKLGESCTVIGATLGGVTAILLLILVGVVLGWVWTCQSSKR